MQMPAAGGEAGQSSGVAPGQPQPDHTQAMDEEAKMRSSNSYIRDNTWSPSIS